MHHQMDGPSFTSHLKSLGRIFFFLLLTPVCTGQPQTVVATVGDDVILPCLVEPAKDISSYTLEWARPDLNPRFVHAQRNGHELVEKKHEFFEGRTSMFMSEQKHGNVSLKLSKVRMSDEGTYKCFIPILSKEYLVQLIVASDAASSPVITLAGINRDKGGLEFQCESAGWYPKPEVLWLDGEGKLLSAGPTEITRGPDGLFTVSSRVTVEKSSNNFTCRVQQENVNRPKERHVQVPDDFFRVSTSSDVPIIACLAVTLSICILLILAGGFFMWKQRQNSSKRKEAIRTNVIKMVKNVTESTELLDKFSWGSKKKQRNEEIENEVEALMEEIKKLREENQKVEAVMEENKKLREENQQMEEQLQEEKRQKEESEKYLQSKISQKKKQFQEENPQRDESEKVLQSEINQRKKQLQKTEKQLKESQKKNYQLEKKLQEEKENQLEESQENVNEMQRNLMKASQSEEGGRQSSSDPSGRQSSSSSDSKTSILDVTVEVDEQRRFIRLRNESRQDFPLRGRTLRVLINKKKSFFYRFYGSIRVEAGGSITLWRPSSAPYNRNADEFVWSVLPDWNPGDQLEVNLCDT